MAVQKQTSPRSDKAQRWPHKRYSRSCASSSRLLVRLDRLGTVCYGCAIAMRRCQSSSRPRSQTVPSYARSTRPPAEIWTQGTIVLLPLQALQGELELRSTPACSSLQIGSPKRSIGRLGFQSCHRYSFARLQFGSDLGNRLQHWFDLDHVVTSVNDLSGDGLGVKRLTVFCFNSDSLLF